MNDQTCHTEYGDKSFAAADYKCGTAFQLIGDKLTLTLNS